MKAAVRCNALTLSGLSAMETHGKRMDRTSQARRIRTTSPLLYKSLDLVSAYHAHVAGARVNSRTAKPALHFIFRFPPDLLTGVDRGRFVGSKSDRQKEMMRQAIKFVNVTHGGNAVFEARMDRDEIGETIVDVFAAPKYEKRTKRTPADQTGEIWISPTRFGKMLARKHEEEIRHRHPLAKPGPLTSPRMTGIALQSEFGLYFAEMNNFSLDRKREKKTFGPDRLEKEQYDRLMRRAMTQTRWDARRQARLNRMQAALISREAHIDQRERALAADEARVRAHLAELNADRVAAQAARVETEKAIIRTKALTTGLSSLADEIAAGTLRQASDGRLNATVLERLRAAYPEIAPAVGAAARFVEKMDAMEKQVVRKEEEINIDMLEVQCLFNSLEPLIVRMKTWLSHPDLPANLAMEGVAIRSDVRDFLSSPHPHL